MRIVMFTNLYFPFVGGLQRSITTFRREFERLGEDVLIVTPVLDDQPLDDSSVVRVPAIRNVNGTDFSVAIPIPGYLSRTLDEFAPDIVHSHHPFLLGDTALRTAKKRDCPLIFTYHTMWEHYLHYASANSPAMRAFVKRMASEYCNLCDHVIAPCQSIETLLRKRGVMTSITAIPTGIDLERFRQGNGEAGRRRLDIPPDAFVAGYIGRLAPEKNLGIVAEALTRLCARQRNAHTLLVGDGEEAPRIERVFRNAGLEVRLHMPGTLEEQYLVDAYHALDVFAFASKSETQGIVLAEAMAAGCPVVGLDAPGARDIIRDGENGRLLTSEDQSMMADAILEIAEMPAPARADLIRAAKASAEPFSSENCATRLLQLYRERIQEYTGTRAAAKTTWSRSRRRWEAEWNLWSGRAAALLDALNVAAPAGS